MPLSLLFCHGWGFDAAMWDPLAALLPEFAQVRDDAGYFGGSAAALPSGPVLAVTHSFGTMRLLAAPPPGLAGMVAINGFDRFTAAPDFPGVPARVVDRMVSAVAQEPETVLADFHARVGSAVPAGEPLAERLQAGLVTLRDGDLRAVVGQVRLPILSLQGARDTLLPMGLRETVFAAVPGVMRRTHPEAGHLLPSEDPAWCADAIRSFAATLA
ncbi:pimeloyl-[acyl-carrier protein] methyl ester esterase [Novosphingobium chloroacetimidivorans]|uniref:Pimeloyl-[acyl-carrier protein] methyl ester esterase n=1 Tax=Novosphingobium chloroacetimidivorans TaxID=1428314 RepID=A0A7W7K8G6_9SPHN|nr:alpha/beta hydrolase [Novosphingobium chloroacetimidivorans]MBB4857488.1 pimeloyl-[acyl-carrier protein] methyl ester esterase [Novosphingobium chloroacetimidivorans]